MAHTSPTAYELVSRALDCIEKNSIQGCGVGEKRVAWYRAKSIDWDDFKDKAFYDLNSVKTSTIEDACGVIDRALMRLQDGHSLMSYPGFVRTLRPDYGAKLDPRKHPDNTWAFHKKNWHRNIPETALQFTGKGGVFKEPNATFFDGILHLELPAFYNFNDEDQSNIYRDKLRDSLRQSAQKSLQGVIVDLRKNYGGDMRPMLGGLSPLLGSETAGYFKGRSGLQPFYINHGHGSQNQISHHEIEKTSLAHAPVAVLAGHGTCSSGEAVFLGFRGRPNTQSFGRRTYGNSSGNASYPITPDNKLFIHLCTAVTLDRNYKGSGDGDENRDGGKITVNHLTLSSFDTALKWLKEGAPPPRPHSGLAPRQNHQSFT